VALVWLVCGDDIDQFYSSLTLGPGGLCTIIPGLKVMGSVPCAYLTRLVSTVTGNYEDAAHLHVLLSSLLPLLGHSARSVGVGEQARNREDEDGGTDNTSGQHEDLAALIGGRRSAGSMGTESDVVCCIRSVLVR
jgi:hypothetical protein